MKKIDYDEILKEAREKELSPHTIIKRKLNYRKAKGLDLLCKYCKSLTMYQNNFGKISTIQCEVIGEGFNGYSAVNLKFTCDNHKK